MQTKKNGLALRVLSTATFLAMVASCTAPAFAGTYYLENGDITVDAKEDGNYISQGEMVNQKDEGDTIITDHKDETDTSAVNNTVTINVDDKATGEVTIKDANIDNSNTTEKAGISVDTKGENATANITLSNVTVDPGKDNKDHNNAGGAGLEVKGNGTTSIELNGDNTLTGGTSHAGVEKSNSKTDSKGVGEGKLVINDDYNDDGTEKTIADRIAEVANGKYSGSLTANGSGSAGIGGSEWNSATSNITITGGNITANGGRNSAGIGGAVGGTLVPGSGDAENIEITGGNIIANGSICGAGIGSGETGSTSIKISGGTIHASSKAGDQMGSGAGIGSGENGTGADITISGGIIYADGSSGIGTGCNDWGGAKIDISDETDDTFIIASGEYAGRGIGSGHASSSNSLYDITIDGGEIYANGGIGIGSDGDGAPSGKITINGGKIAARTNATGSAGIGNGWDTCGDVDKDGNGGTMDITITGGDITAVGGEGAAGIGDGKSNHYNTVNVNITGGTIKAVGGEGAAAIGGGQYQDDDEENLTKTTVKIDSKNNALKITAIVQGDSKGAIGNGTMDGDDPFSGVDFDDITAASLGEEHGALVQFMNNYDAATGTGTLYKAIHNKKYIEETYNNPNDDHEWGNPQIIKEAAPGVQGIIRYTCVVDGCGATHDVPYDYVEPEEPDDTPTVTPTTPDAKPDTPTTPDTPAQDDTADTTPADSAVLPGSAQNPDVLDTKPDAAVTPENAKNPAVQDAKALPQTGSNWLAVLGTALSGAFLMAVGFVLNRKRGENR